MLTKHLYGSIIYNLEDIGFTKEVIIEKYHKALPYQNVAFKFNGIVIETAFEGGHIKISKQQEDKDWVYDVLCSTLKFKTVEDFADLVLNYSDEKVKSEYEVDKLQDLKNLIDNMDLDMKDDLLLALLSKTK